MRTVYSGSDPDAHCFEIYDLQGNRIRHVYKVHIDTCLVIQWAIPNGFVPIPFKSVTHTMEFNVVETATGLIVAQARLPTSQPNPWPDDEITDKIEYKCTCGAETADSPKHSVYCDKYMP